jgi:inhibitor of nuclear factor kappa-B kinase subunit alpha
MGFTAEDRVLVKILRVEKRYSARKFINEFPNRNWSLAGLNRLLKQIDATGSAAERKKGSVKRRMSRTAPNIATVEELILSQEGKPGTHRTVREIAAETGISKSSVHRIVHKDLSLKCFKKKQAQELTTANKLARLTRAKRLLKTYPNHLAGFIWFTDEKIFTVTPAVNLQNDRLYASAGTRKRELSADRCLRTRSNFSQSVMVSVAVSALGSTDLFFIEPGVKINGAYYRDVLLLQYLLPAIKELSANDFFIFQQDSAPAHRARETVELLARETPDFISPLLWPPNSPDLNPVDYKIWGVLQERLYRTRILDVMHLKERLVEEWAKFDQRVIDRAVQQWLRRLRACVRAEGGHFEHQL